MPRVLLVEDDTALATALHLALRRLGHDVTTNPSGETALRTLLDDRVLPDVVILDPILPGIDDFEVCRRVRAALPVFDHPADRARRRHRRRRGVGMRCR